MATEFFFNGRLIKQPGAYATIVAGQRNAPLNLDYGRILVIDTGVAGARYGGGAGINGQLAQGKDAVYRFNNVEDYQFFLKGGLLYRAADGFFRPDVNIAATGASEILHARSATTTSGTMTFTAVGGGSNGGTFAFRTRDEGLIANGELNETRAQSTLTITDAGATGDTITLTLNTVTIATYTNAASDTVATVRDGLIADLQTRGLSNLISTTTTGFVFTHLANQGDDVNGDAFTPTVTGSLTATATAFSGGIDGTELIRGFAYQIVPGIVDTSQWILRVFVGTWTGLHTDNISYNEVTRQQAEPRLLAESPEFNNIQTLIDWGNTNSQFGQFFQALSTNAINGDGSVDAADITAVTGYQFATGGTEAYSSLRLNEILTAVQDELFSFIYVDISGTTVHQNAQIITILNWMRNTSRYERMLFVGAGNNESDFTGSIAVAQGFDRDDVVAVHGGVGFASQAVAGGFRFFNSLINTAYVLGRTAGRPPQVPVTNKTLGFDILQHNLNDQQKDRSLDAGLLVPVFNQFINRIVVLQGVNTLQDNKVIFNNMAQSHQISFKRIVAQINMELIVNAQTSLLADELGVNVNTLSAGIIRNFTETYLTSRVAIPDLDNLLLDFRDIVVTREQDAWRVNYAIVVNNEINKLFFTGFLFS